MLKWIFTLSTIFILGSTLTFAGGQIPFLFFPSASKIVAPFTWLGGGGNSNWNNTANWSNGIIPGSGDIAIFDDNCSGANCNVTVNVDPNVSGIDMKSTYSGTITQGAGVAMTVGSGKWTIAGGTFSGSAANITTNKFSMSGGTFNSTQGSLKVGFFINRVNQTDGFIVTGGTFNHNNGTVEIMGSDSDFVVRTAAVLKAPSGGLNFYNLIFSQSKTLYPDIKLVVQVDTSVGPIQVANALSFTDGSTTIGTISLLGNLNITCTAGVQSGICAGANTTTVKFIASTPQTYSSDSINGIGPFIEIASTSTVTTSSANVQIGKFKLTSGTFTAPSGILGVGYDVNRINQSDGFVINGGTFNHNNGTVEINSYDSNFSPTTVSTIKAPASGIDFYNLKLNAYKTGNITVKDKISLDSTLGAIRVANTMTLEDGSVDTGTLSLSGNLIVNCPGGAQTAACASGGTAALTMTGTAAQTVTIAANALVPTGLFKVDKTSGSASLASNLSLTGTGQNLQINSGTLNMAGFNLSVNSQLQINASGTLLCNGGTYSSGTFSNSGTLTCGQVLAFTTQPTATVNTWTNLPTQPVVTLRSSAGHTSNGSTDAVTIEAYSDATCTTASAGNLSASVNPKSAVAGVATYSGTQLSLLGTYYIKATAGGMTSACSNAIAVSLSLYTWTGAGGNTNWDTTANWSNNAVPGATHTPIFDANCGATCNATMNVPVNILGISLKSSYSGTITQAAGQTVTVGTSGWTQNGGTFTGSDSNITSGVITINAGTFTSTTTTLSINASMTVAAAATFNHNNGTVLATGGASHSTLSIAGSNSFYNATFSKSGSLDVIITGTLTVLNDLSLMMTTSNNTVDTGTIQVGRNLSATNFGGDGTATIKLNGVVNQTVYGDNNSLIANFEIASTLGVVTFTGTPSFARTFTYTSGVVDTSGATMKFTGGVAHSLITNVSSINFYNTEFSKSSNADIQLNGNMTILGNLAYNLATTNNTFETGTVLVSGHLTTSGIAGGGTGLIKFVGSSNQTFTSIAGVRLPNIEIASTGGIVTFTGTFDYDRNFTYTSGTVDMTGTLSRFSNSNTVTIASGSSQFQDVEFSKSSVADITITGTMNINGNLTFGGSSLSNVVDGGSILLKGNLTTTGIVGGGTSTIKLAGNTNQLATGIAGARIPSLEIASTGGTVTITGTLDIDRNITYTSGVVDTSTSTIRFTGSSGSAINAPSMNFQNVEFINSSTLDIVITSTMNIEGNLTIGMNSNVSIDTGTILLKGNLTTTGAAGSGTGLIKLVGSTDQTITGIATAVLPNLEIASTGGTVYLVGTIDLARNLTYTSGSVNPGTSTVNLTGSPAGTVSMGSQALNNLTYSKNSATTSVTIVGTLKLNGNLSLSTGNTNQTLNGGTVEVYGNVTYTMTGGGTTAITFAGAATQTFTRSGGNLNTGTFTVNKTAGSVTLATAISLSAAGQDLTITSGTMNLAGFSLNVNDTLSIAAGGTLQCSGGTYTYGTLSNLGTLNCP